jgi:serine protease Do
VTASAAKLFRLSSTHGLLVASVQPGSAAAKAGLRPGTQKATLAGMTYPLGGDLIDSAAGTQLSSIDQLRDAIAGKKPGDKVDLGVFRGDKHLTITVKLGRQPSS